MSYSLFRLVLLKTDKNPWHKSKFFFPLLTNKGLYYLFLLLGRGRSTSDRAQGPYECPTHAVSHPCNADGAAVPIYSYICVFVCY